MSAGALDREAARGGGWIAASDGRRIWPLDVRPEDIDITDVAHALALTCRWGRRCRAFYSVAQHSVLVHDALKDSYRRQPKLWLHGLLHDAGEAYTGDVPAPIKASFPDVLAAEGRALAAVLRHVGLDPVLPVPVHVFDKRIGADEAVALMPPDCVNLGGAEPLGYKITPWEALAARDTFLARFKQTAAQAGCAA